MFQSFLSSCLYSFISIWAPDGHQSKTLLTTTSIIDTIYVLQIYYIKGDNLYEEKTNI